MADSEAVSLPTLAVVAASSRLPGQSSEVGDTSATTTIYVIVAVLIVIGVLLAALAAWLVRQTRPDRQLLAPLEYMERRTWRRLDPQGRRRALDEARPPGAVPIARAKSTPDVDREFAALRPVRDFSDLADRVDAPAETPEPIGDVATGSGTATIEDDGAEIGHAAPDVVEREQPVEESDDAAADDAAADDAAADDATTDDEPDADPTEADRVADVDPLVIDTELADPTLLGRPFGEGRTIDVVGPDDEDGAPLAPRDARSVDESSVSDDTGEYENEIELEADVPLMPGEGLLRRPRSDADRR